MRSISDGNAQRLSKLLRYGAGLKITPDDLATALIASIKQSREECVASILKAGGDANASDEEGRPAIFVLMEFGRGNPQILKLLLHAGANPNKVTWSAQQTALHAASKKGLQVCIKQLLLAGAHVDRQDATGSTALMCAAKEGHVTTLRSLLSERANVNLTNSNQETALHLAVKSQHSHCVHELLCNQADPSITDIRGQSALLLAMRQGDDELVDLLLDHHASVNGQDKVSGKTILHLAIEMQNIPLIVKLLEMNADPNVRDKEWQTPFLLALNMGRRDIMEHLLKAGCKITATDRSFNTPLHVASINGQADMIPLFVERGLDVNLKGSGGMTPIMLAAFGAHAKTVQILLYYGANSSLTDRNHASALVYAILSKEPIELIYDVIKILIKSNCDVNHAANLNKIIKTFAIEIDKGMQVEQRLYSPLELAFLRGDSAMFMMLLRAGCDTSTFHCDKDITLQNFKSVHSDLKSRWLLLRGLKRERKNVRSLKELCRRPLLKSFGQKAEEQINALPISEPLKRFLHFSDVDEVCDEYSAGNHAPSSPLSPTGSKSPRTPVFSSPFARNTRTRATIHTAGNTRQRSFSSDQSKPTLPKASWDIASKKLPKAKTPKPRSNSVIATPITDSILDRRRIISMSSTSQLADDTLAEEDAPMDRPKIGLFKYMKSKVMGTKDKQPSKARSKKARDPRETINMLLHGSSEEYMSSGEITPRPLNMASIEKLNDIEKSPTEEKSPTLQATRSPVEEQATVNRFLYGKSLRSPDDPKDDISDRLRSIRRDRLSQIEADGVEDYINKNDDSNDVKVDNVFDFNLKMEALTNAPTFTESPKVSRHREPRSMTSSFSDSPNVSRHRQPKTVTPAAKHTHSKPGSNFYPNGEPVSPETSPILSRKQTNLDNINSLLFGKPSKPHSKAHNTAVSSNTFDMQNDRHPLSSSRKDHVVKTGSADNKLSHPQTLPLNGFTRPAAAAASRKPYVQAPPSVDVSQTASSNSPSLLSPPTSTADSTDSSGSSGHVTFRTGDAQLMHKYLTSQDAPLTSQNEPDAHNGSSHDTMRTPTRFVTNGRDVNGNAASEPPPSRFERASLNMNSGGLTRTSSISSVESSGSRRSFRGGSKIPVLRHGWSPSPGPTTKIPMPVSPAITPSSRGFGNFVRSKSVRKW